MSCHAAPDAASPLRHSSLFFRFAILIRQAAFLLLRHYAADRFSDAATPVGVTGHCFRHHITPRRCRCRLFTDITPAIDAAMPLLPSLYEIRCHITTLIILRLFSPPHEPLLYVYIITISPAIDITAIVYAITPRQFILLFSLIILLRH